MFSMSMAFCAGVPDSQQHRSETCPNGTRDLLPPNRAALMSLVWCSNMRHLYGHPAGELPQPRPVWIVRHMLCRSHARPSRKERSVEPTINLDAAYQSAYLIRATEDAIRARYHDDPQPTAAVGVAQAFDAAYPNDEEVPKWYGYSTHRCHAHYLAMGGDLHAMIAELYGKGTGCAGGWGGSMHLVDESAGFMGTSAIVGSSVSIAVGHALGMQLMDYRLPTVAWAGDAVPETGQFWEAINFAALKKLRLIVVIEDNGYATSTPVEQRQGIALADWFTHALPATKFIGDDVIEVYRATQQIIENDVWPALLNITTQRHYGHVGMGTDADLNYRDETERRSAPDPLVDLRRYIQSEDRLQAIEQAIDARVASAFRYAEVAPWPTI